MQPASEPAKRRDGLSNILRNLAWILGGKGFGAVCSENAALRGPSSALTATQPASRSGKVSA